MKYFKKAFEGVELTRENNRMYGVYRGYHISAMYNTSTGELVTVVTYAGGMEGAKERIQASVNQAVSDEKKPPVVTVGEHFVQIHNSGSYPLKKLCQYAEKYVESTIKVLMAENCTSGCQACGESVDVGNYEINGSMHVLCATCAKEIVGKFESNKQQIRANKSNLFPGLFGAFIGSLVGVALWVLIYQLGYLAGIAGAAMIVCAMMGYEKLGKALDVKGVIASFLVTIVMIFVANQLSWALAITIELGKVGIDLSFFEVNGDLFDIVKELDLMGEFIGDLAIGYLLFIVAGISTVINAFKSARGSYNMKKL